MATEPKQQAISRDINIAGNKKRFFLLLKINTTDEIKTDAADSGEKKSAGKKEQSEAAKDHDDTVVQMVKNDAE